MASKSASELAQEAFSECLQSIARDMPLVMHGSGDVPPSQVDPQSVRLLSELTVQYISNLVDAAIDSHELMNDGPQPLPPPPLPMDHRKPPLPSPPVPTTASTTGESASTSTNKKDSRKRPRRKATDEFWDEPLPEPKIKGKPAPTQSNATGTGFLHEGVDIDHWVGVAGVDFWEQNRARKAHVGRNAIGTQCFIFPICHDVGLYGKVLEIQTARRSIQPLLHDPVIMEVVRTEGASSGPSALRKRDKPKEDETEDPEDTDSEGEDGATWPGLEYLLPVHGTIDFRDM